MEQGELTLVDRMGNSTVRIARIEIRQVKNVERGSIDLENARNMNRASVLGMYGQNGSGKTALIEAIQLLKVVMSGEQIASDFRHLISVDQTQAFFCFEFFVNIENGESYDVFYEFVLEKFVDEKSVDEQPFIFDDLENISKKTSIRIKDEKISLRSNKTRKHEIFNSRIDDQPFSPLSNLKYITKGKKDLVTSLIAFKKIASETARSYFFSSDFINLIKVENKDSLQETKLSELFILQRMKFFAMTELLVFSKEASGDIYLHSLPLIFREDRGHTKYCGIFRFSLRSPNKIPSQVIEIVQKLFDQVNMALEALVPGLNVKMHSLGSTLLNNSERGEIVEFVSVRNNREIALRYESEGVKKIVAVLNMLICAFNNPSVTVAIDELDSGIFEYLLGELLSVFANHAFGQLIFTSHNLRPLEIIDPSFIGFTTIAPKRRYAKLHGIKATNNLRGVYYRSIVLGLGDVPLYDETNNTEIEMALRQAGRVQNDIP